MTDCEHVIVQAWRTDDGVVRLWACADCRRRFAPTVVAPAASPEARGGGCDGTCMGWASPGPCPACVEPYQPATASAAATSEEGGE